jgi:ferric-chelate reductase
VFFSGRLFESHPLSIFSASPDTSCITSIPPGISLGVRAIGDWSIALNTFANEGAAAIQNLSQEKHADDPIEVPVQVMVDGPYGGCSVDLGEYETAVLIAGGAGITFTLGLLDDIVGRCVRQGRKNGERTRRIEFAWCVRSFGEFYLQYIPLAL